MRQAGRSVWAWLVGAFDRQDVTILLALVLIAVGGSKIYEPLAWLLPGVALMLLAWPKRPVVVRRPPPQES
jgi:hypothetical protein